MNDDANGRTVLPASWSVTALGLEDVPIGAHIDVDAAADAVAALLTAMRVPATDHTTNTPRRVARAYASALRGYQVDPRRHLEVTFPPPPGAAGVVIVSGIRVVSTCAHHMLPIVGTATVAYRPVTGARIVGLSKLARVVEEYAARLQVQEQLTGQVAAAVWDALDVVGAGCVITAEHGCMTLRGVASAGTTTTTAAWQGAWLGDPGGDVAAVWAQHRESPRG
jgi:GTP cyclohydrolase I